MAINPQPITTMPGWKLHPELLREPQIMRHGSSCGCPDCMKSHPGRFSNVGEAMTEPTKPALTVEQEFSDWWVTQTAMPTSPHWGCSEGWGAKDAWQASRRQRDKEFIDMLKAEADNDPRYAIALYAISDELEAELNSKETGQ